MEGEKFKMKTIFKVMAIVTTLALLITIAYADPAPELYGADQLEALLANVDEDICPGAAGCALRSTARAAELMKWGMNTAMPEDEIKSVVDGITGKLSEERVSDFNEALTDIYSAYCSLLTEDSAQLMEDAGIDATEYDFSGIETVPAVETVMICAGIIE